jgi:hypothetical protein
MMTQASVIQSLNRFNDYFQFNRENKWMLREYITNFVMLMTPSQHRDFITGLESLRKTCENRRWQRSNCNRFTGELNWIYFSEGSDVVTVLAYEVAQGTYDKYRF